MVYSDWRSPEPGLELGLTHGQMSYMVLCRTFDTALEQGQGPTPIVPHCSGSGPGACPGTGHSECDCTITIQLIN